MEQLENSGLQDEEEDSPGSEEESYELFPDDETVSNDDDTPTMERGADFLSGRVFRFVRSICFNSIIEFTYFSFITLVMELRDCVTFCCFYALVDIVIRFFNTDLPLLVYFSVIEIKRSLP